MSEFNEKSVTHYVSDDVQEVGISNDQRNTKEEDAVALRKKIFEIYGREGQAQGGNTIQTDIQYIIDCIVDMTDDRAMEILVQSIEYHSDDPNFPSASMQKLKNLVQGPKACELDDDDYSIELRTEASIIYYHSPYPEVRAVTDPFDDPDSPCETFRSYALGFIFMAGATTLNTFFSPRQPNISISSTVLQLLLAPCGVFLAKVLPDWGITVFGKRHSLNPGPWSYKEQMFATIIFTVANTPGGTYYIYLVQKLPQYLDRTWVTFGYEIVLAISVQFFGFGFAGVLRKFAIYPVKSIWPKVMPILALNRALMVKEKEETVYGWSISRYRFFLLCFIGMFLYFWIPNFLFTALHSFNWMTWISPNNFNLGMITGFYGGLGFNPISTFDWNVSGTNSLVTPFFSYAQQYAARVLSGLIIIAMYWGNQYWSAYMPINSNEPFANDGSIYNVTKLLTNGLFDLEKYKAYGPPFFSGANVFGQGAWFAWYPMTLFYVTITEWRTITTAFIQIYRGLRYRDSNFSSFEDPHSRMMSRYKEVPDWWFFVILLLSLVLGIIALEVYPVLTPVWSLFAVIGLSAVLIVPSVVMLSIANVGLGFGVFFQLLAGVWFVGNPEAVLIATAYGNNFDSQTEVYVSDQKLAHYSKLPPRAIFRGQMLSVLVNCFIFIGFLNWMITSFETQDLCQWDNPQHFVCTDAVLWFATAIEYGAFGVPNMMALYPILPWCFLIGSLVGIGFGLFHKYGSEIRAFTLRRASEAAGEKMESYIFKPLSYLKGFSPSVAWAGSLNWTGGNNLSYATNGLYLSFIFMYFIKRRYTAWFERYNYLVEAGFDVGVAISGIVQTLAFDFSSSAGVSLKWWGNEVAQAGVDYQSYNQNATLLPIPEVGYFGPSPENYPMHF
jgi:OPT family small oligopeptide transporter